MRVLQVGSSLYTWAGIERYIIYLATGLQRQGHDVVVVCPPGSPLDQRHSGSKWLIGNSSAPRGKTRARWLNLAPMIRHMKGQRFDVVHTHYSPDFSIAAVAARLTRQPRIVMTRHLALKWSPPKMALYRGLYDHFICVSEAVQQALVTSGIPARKVSVARMGLPEPPTLPNRAELREALGLPSDAFLVGFFGRLVKEKGVDVLLEAATKANNWRFEIVGDGPARPQLEAHMVKLGVEGRTTFRGFIPEPQRFMAAMNVITVPSLWDEAFPAVALEAMSLGVPVVGSRIGGLPEMIADGMDGLLAERGNPDELFDCIQKIEADRSLGERLSTNALKRQREEFSLPAMVSRFERVYETVPAAR